MHKMMTQRGMTLVELLVSAGLLVGGGGALLFGMHYSMIHSQYVSQFQTVMNAVQGRLEELASTNFQTLWEDAAFANARGASGQCMGLGEDVNCNSMLDVGEDLDSDGQMDEPVPGARLIVQIRASPPGAANPTLLDLHVAACWTVTGRRLGEDQNCNGQLDGGEDVNGDGWATSPAMASARVAMRE